jgi:hypothetical protein
MSDSSRPKSDEEPPEHVKQGWLAAVFTELDVREQLCRSIAEHANAVGLDCDWRFVNRHLDWFKRWHSGMIATGYLMGRTGVKRKVVNIEHWSD